MTNVGTAETPIQLPNGLEGFRQNDWWFIRNPNSQWSPCGVGNYHRVTDPVTIADLGASLDAKP